MKLLAKLKCRKYIKRCLKINELNIFESYVFFNLHVFRSIVTALPVDRNGLANYGRSIEYLQANIPTSQRRDFLMKVKTFFTRRKVFVLTNGTMGVCIGSNSLSPTRKCCCPLVSDGEGTVSERTSLLQFFLRLPPIPYIRFLIFPNIHFRSNNQSKPSLSDYLCCDQIANRNIPW